MVLSSTKIKALAQSAPRQVSDILTGKVQLDDSVPENLRVEIEDLRSLLSEEQLSALAAKVGEILHPAVLRAGIDSGLRPKNTEASKSVKDKVTIPVAVARKDAEETVALDGDDLAHALGEMLAENIISGNASRPSRRIRGRSGKKRHD